MIMTRWGVLVPPEWTRAVFTAERRCWLPLSSYEDEECPSAVRRVGSSWELVLQPATDEDRARVLQHLTGQRGRTSACTLRFESGPKDPSIWKPFWAGPENIDAPRSVKPRTGTEAQYDEWKENG